MLHNPLLTLFPHLGLFEKKIIKAIARHVSIHDADTKAYCLSMLDFELDNLNPSDITERLRWLKNKRVCLPIDDDLAFVPLLTDIRYNDRQKNVTITFNSILKPHYASINGSTAI